MRSPEATRSFAMLATRRLSAPLLACLLLAACSPAPSGNNGQVAVVDGVGISAATLEAVAKDAGAEQRKAQLEALVDEQVFANAAVKAGMDKLTNTAVALEAARRQILAKAFVADALARQPTPSEAAIKAFYAAHPELFAERKAYRVQELAIFISAERVGEVSKAFTGMKTLGERVAWLKKTGIQHASNVVVRPAEDWPADVLAKLASMKEGAAFDLPNPKGFSILQLTGVEAQAVTLEQAKAKIARYLVNEGAEAFLRQQKAELRKAAKVEYPNPVAAR